MNQQMFEFNGCPCDWYVAIIKRAVELGLYTKVNETPERMLDLIIAKSMEKYQPKDPTPDNNRSAFDEYNEHANMSRWK